MSKINCYVGKDSLIFDEKSNKYLLCGEELPQSWRSAGFEPIKKKIQETNALIFVCKNGGTSKEFRKKYQMLMKQKKSADAKVLAIDFPVFQNQMDSSGQMDGSSGLGLSPVNLNGKKMTFAEAVRAVIIHRRCSKIKAVAFLSQLPKVKKEKKLKDLHHFLDSLVNILQALCNLRDKDLRTKAVLSRSSLKHLRQESGQLTEPSTFHKIEQPVIEFAKKICYVQKSNINDKTLCRRKSTLVFEGKETNEDDTDSMKSWDDLVSFKSKMCMDEGAHQASRKLPPWQLVAMEATDSNKNWSRVGRRAAELDCNINVVVRITNAWNLVRARQAYESKHMVRNIERIPFPESTTEIIEPSSNSSWVCYIHLRANTVEKVQSLAGLLREILGKTRMEHMRNRIHLATLDMGLSCLEYYQKIASANMPKSNIIDLNEKEIEKMTWCHNIEDECNYFIDSDPDVRFPQLEKLKKFSLLDFTKVNFVKAKLCLYVLSLPANEVLAIPTQRALLFALSSILQLSRGILKQWLDSRNLPLYNIDPLAE